MLEKIGLPPKPSIRGGSWVVDASHCQGCSSQFTFINRKHHCRRCGGLFCNSCTQQRMVLRGQGDSPVRICAPCKNLEEAARFELRHGHKIRASKGSSKQTSNHEEVLNEILGSEGTQSLLSEPVSHADVISDLLRTTSSPASTQAKSAASVSGGHSMRSSSVNVENHSLDVIGGSSPEELRQRAVDEKKKYKILKGEGKSEEALQAFKRGKELERQAAALEIQLRKNRRMASKASTLSSVSVTDKSDDFEEPGSKKKKVSSQMGKVEKDDLAAELKELGWTDADIHDADKKPVKPSLEGELSKLLSELPQKASQGKGTGGIDRTQVTAHKRQALIFKREGKLAEAKEELKKAKILEKQIEEQELLGGADDSDDELSALINSMDDDDDKQDDLLLDYGHDPSFDFHQLLGVGHDPAGDDNFEVTDDDMNDPELVAALQSFGWTEEDDQADDNDLRSAPLDQEALTNKVLALKRESLSQKRAGNVPEAMDLLKKANQLEKELEDMRSSEPKQKSSTYPISGETSIPTSENLNTKLPPKSKLAIQRELLSIKKNALVLRREGRIEEAEEELKKGRALENQLEEIENVSKRPDVRASKKNVESSRRLQDGPEILDLEEAGVDVEVTEQDMHDPALLSVLKSLGWEDEDVEATRRTNKTSKQIKDVSDRPSVVPVKKFKNKAEIQRELLASKRKALALRRQGKTEEAEEELERAKVLEKQMEEMETSHIAGSAQVESHGFGLSENPQEKSDNRPNDADVKKVDDGHKDRNETAVSDKHSLSKPGLKAESWLEDWVSNSNKSVQSVDAFGPVLDGQSIIVESGTQKVTHTESLESGNLSQANAGIKLGDQISAGRQETKVSVSVSSVNPEQNLNQGTTHKDEILAHKRKALALKREGKLAEAKEELRQAKLLEKSLEDGQRSEVESKTAPTPISDDAPVIQEIKPKQAQKPLSGRERLKLQQESLAHKRSALKLRREGKIEESEAELELAKALESQLEEAGAEGTSSSMSVSQAAPNDTAVEGLLDPQLMSALKSIGWSDSDMFSQPSKKPESKPITGRSEKSVREKSHLEEQIKNEKLRAVNLKKAGNQAEALEALRAAKRLEKKLASLSS